MSIHRTVIQIEVFSEGPFRVNGGDADPFDLAEINYAISEGDCIGQVETISTEVVPDNQVIGHLERIGNDGTFFEGVDG